VSILRGLRERYEVHHGVRISDSALVEAAVLSDRYLADRYVVTGQQLRRLLTQTCSVVQGQLLSLLLRYTRNLAKGSG
jgi:phage gp36-like protein